MGNNGRVVIIRLGHRPGRDDRMTTHVGLTARALGADRFVLVGGDAGPLDRINDVTERFGGPFGTDRVDSIGSFLSDWKGTVVHLTMYGLPVQEVIESIQETSVRRSTDLAIVVGAGKVPFSVYERADWNVAITNQPHSEVASLAVFLDRLWADESLEKTFEGGTHHVVPQECGKLVEECEPE